MNFISASALTLGCATHFTTFVISIYKPVANKWECKVSLQFYFYFFFGGVFWAFKKVSQYGSLGYTITGKTSDLTVVQKTIIDTLHKEDKPQTFIAKEAGCSQSAVFKHINRELSGRKKCKRKRCTPNERTAALRIVKQNPFKNLSELHKEWTEAGVKASRATTHRRVNEFGYSCHQRHLTWAKEKKNWTVTQGSKVLFSDESKFCISFGNQGPRV